MLTDLPTVKSRLSLEAMDPTYDATLLRVIAAISARFDLETNRTLGRTENAIFEFSPDETEIVVPAYPIESVTKFELKNRETGGWVEQPEVDYLIRRDCIICLAAALGGSSTTAPALARVTYTGGYLVPGSSPNPASVALPAELEQAAVEQVVFWFQTRDRVGVVREWPHGGNYQQYADPDLLPSAREVLRRYRRVSLL